MAVFEQDGSDYGTITYNRNGFNYTLAIHDGDDSLGSALVSFYDPNCGYYSTGDSELYLRYQGASVCGEASCVAPQGTYISHFTGSGCTGTESYYLPYDGWAYQCRPGTAPACAAPSTAPSPTAPTATTARATTPGRPATR